MSVTTPSLPSSWAEVPLSAIAVVNPRGSNTELPDETVVSFLPMKAVAEETGSFDLGASRPVSEVRKGYTQFQDGDILIAKITPCMENGKAAVVSGLRHGIGYGSTEFHVVRLLSPEFDRRFYFHYIVQSGFRREARRHMTGSAGQLRVPSAYLAEVPVPVPPLPEQRRIVAKIEELFTRLDAGVAALQAVKQQIKRYRQAVLRDAFTGKLTEEWRERELRRPYSPLNKEPGTALLGRIIRLQPPGTGPAQATRQDASKQARGRLPAGWCWSTAGQLLKGFRSGTTAVPQDARSATPILRSSAVRECCLDLHDVRFLSPQHAVKDDDFVAEDDLLFVRLSGSLEYVGACARVTSLPNTRTAYPDRLFKARPVLPEMSRFIEALFASPTVRAEVKACAKSTAGHKRVSTGGILDRVLPLPPLAEQMRIVAEIDRHFSLADAAEKAVDESLAKAEHLRQSILRQAFEGRLVPQDPNDEPAEKLLARIRAEKSRIRAGTASPWC